jgi:Flp pilus assembly protein CpaB
VKRSNRLLILLGLLIAIAAALAAAVYVSSGTGGGGTTGGGPQATATATPEPTVQVVAAATAIPAGTEITADMLKLKTMTLSARDALGADTFGKISDVVNKIAGSDIAADQVIVASQDLLSPGSVVDGKDLSSSIAAGMVAVSMEVDQTNGVGTLIVPGDHVDIILSVYVDQLAVTYKYQTTAGGITGENTIPFGGSQLTTKTVIQDRRILATLLPPVQAANATIPPAAGASAGPTAAPSSPIVQLNGRHMIAIVEVTPDEAEVIRWAQRAEVTSPQNYIDLSLALRSAKDDQPGASPDTTITTDGVIFRTLVEKYKVLPPDPTWTLPQVLQSKIQW